MAIEDADGEGSATVADTPHAKRAEDTVVLDGTGTQVDRPEGSTSKPKPEHRTTTASTTIAGPSHHGSSLSLTTAADALRDEEVERTRLFIRMGWAISIATIAAVPLLAAPIETKIALVAAMVLGLIVSFIYHQRFADPRRYNSDALLRLAVMCVVNAHVAILYFGPYTVAPVIVVVGIHFVSRTEAERVARWIFGCACSSYAAITIPIIVGSYADPGVFRTDRILPTSTLIVGAVFVLGTYVLAYATARSFRKASLASIEELQRTTRLASQRAALMEELRADLERALRIGGPGRHTDQVVGGFKLGIVIGRGAMGEVYEATHQTTNEPGAIKLLRRELLADPTHVARFLREVRASAALDSPNIVRVIEASADEAAVPFLAMERLHGHTLAELLRREPKLAPPHVIELVQHVGAGIDAAAVAGIIHRDLKPQNLFRTETAWKILDFGVATLAEDSGTLTQGGIVGTPSYMAPEQAQGKRVDVRADIYALAAVAYRCLTGRHPFTAPDTPALLYAVVHKMPPRPGTIAELPADVDAWFAVAIAKSSNDRFASGAQLADALAAAFNGQLDSKLRGRAEGLLRRHPWEAVT